MITSNNYFCSLSQDVNVPKVFQPDLNKKPPFEAYFSWKIQKQIAAFRSQNQFMPKIQLLPLHLAIFFHLVLKYFPGTQQFSQFSCRNTTLFSKTQAILFKNSTGLAEELEVP